LYRIGRGGLPLDPKLAMHWYKKSAENGYSEAMVGIASLYYYGEGVPKNKRTAETWFRKAANLDNPNALRMIELEKKKMFPWTF